MYGFYKNLKNKDKQKARHGIYENLLESTLISMFDYTGDNIDETFIEMNLINVGLVGYSDKEKCFVSCAPIGSNKNKYGIPLDYNYSLPDGKTGTFTDGETGVVVWNNNIKTGDSYIYNLSDFLAETDLSMYTNVLWARLSPIVETSDSKTSAQIEQILKRLKNGEITTITSNNFVDSLLNNGNYENIKKLNLTDVKDIDKLKYLCDFKEYLLKSFYTTYGQNMQTTTKRAQTNESELHGMDSISTIIPLDKLKQRQNGINKINELFNTNYSVDFSKSFKHEIEEILNKSSEERENESKEGEADDN